MTSSMPILRRFCLQSVAVGMLGLLLFMTGCAMTFGYRHADWLIRWQLDRYLDLNSGQRREVTTRLQAILSRHRTEALPQYEQFLKEAQQRLRRGLTGEDIDWIYGSYDRFRADLFERVSADGGIVLATMTEKQAKNFADVTLKEEQKGARRLQAPISTRLEERAKTMLSWAEDWLGPIQDAQAAQIRQWSKALPDTQSAWWQYRHHRHQELLSLMRHQRTASEAAQALRAMFVTPEQTAPAIYTDTVRDLRAGLKTMLLGIDRTLTPVQRLKAVASLQKLIDDVHSLHVS